MKIKRIVLFISLTIFMVFSLLFVVSDSKAYWASSVVDSATTSTGTITTGSWNQVFQWSPNETYLEGDIVFFQGNFYQAKRDNPQRTPGGQPGWQADWVRL